jgi:hypothetical protein
MISQFNGGELMLDLHDVQDNRKTSPLKPVADVESPVSMVFDAEAEDAEVILPPSLRRQPSTTPMMNDEPVMHYHSTATTPIPSPDAPIDVEEVKLPTPRRPRLNSIPPERRKSVYETQVCWALPRWLRKPLWAWVDRVAMVLTPEWLRTTLLVWAAWCTMSLGLPKSHRSSIKC